MSPSSASSPSTRAGRVRSPFTLRSSSSTTNDGDAQEPWTTNDGNEKQPWMETATPGKFDGFQAKIFPVIEYLTAKPEHANHAFTKRWLSLKRTPNTPMTVDITWRNLKILLGIKTMFEYRDFLTQCPGFSSAVKLKNSRTTKCGFDFGIYSSYKAMLSSPTSSQEQSTSKSSLEDESYVISPNAEDQSYVFDVDVSPESVAHNPEFKETQVIEVLNETSNTPRQTNVTALCDAPQAEATDGLITSDATTASINTSAWEAVDEEATGFCQVHFRPFETVTTWTQHDGVRQHPFYKKWQKAVFSGFDSTTKWPRVAKLFKLASFQDYIDLMYECPRVQEHFELSWDYFTNTVRYKDLALPETEDVLQDISKFNALQRKLHQMAFKFNSCMQQYDSRLADADARITGCEVNISEQLNCATSKFATSAAKHYNSLTEYASQTFAKFQSNINDYTEKVLATQRSKIMDMHTANHLKMKCDFVEAEQAFYARLEQAVERAIQEILSTADDATEGINAQAEYVFQHAPNTTDSDAPPKGSSWKYAEPTPSKLFPNVDVSKISSVPKHPGHPALHQPPNQLDDDHEEDHNDTETNFPSIGQLSLPNHNSTENLASLPLVSHTDMLKRVNLPYPCREQSYIWYLQLKSNIGQYGVYLIGTDEFQKGKSLCPTVVYGFKITLTRYHEMKGTLYHFLAQRSIISTDHTDLRNIVNRHAVSTDGYHVLYEIMQRIHPALDPDVLFTAPMCNEYSDIHEYYTYLTSFIMHEGFAGRHYNPREQVNHFLRGLDSSYYPAIKRVRSQMDSWKTSDLNVPENLILANLPNNIEKYMEEDGKQAIVRRMGKGNSHRFKEDAIPSLKSEEANRQYVDNKCPLCQTYGHHKQNCDRMAIWMNLKDGAKLVDEKLRTKLLANYAELDNKRRSKKLNKIRGTVRQLYQNGQFAEGEDLLNSAMSFNEHATNLSSTSSDSDSSEAS